MIRSLLTVLCALTLSSVGWAAGGIVVYSGGVTTTTQTILPATGFTSVMQLNYVVLDAVAGTFYRLALFRDGGVKKFIVADTGTTAGAVLSADVKNKTSAYSYLEIINTDNSQGFLTDITDTWLQLKGVVTVAAGRSIDYAYPDTIHPLAAPILTFAQHTWRHYELSIPNNPVGGGLPTPSDEHLAELSGKLHLSVPLSKATNAAAEDLPTALARVESYIHDVLGYAGP